MSGGLDSKLVAKLALSTGTEIEAITIGYLEKSRHDETQSSAKVARELDIKSHVKRISKLDGAHLLRKVCSNVDEPVADIASINYLALFDHARTLDIRVLLMGHGSDELLMGYAWLNKAASRANVRRSTLEGDFHLSSYLKLIQNPFSNSVTQNVFGYFSNVKENVFTLKQVIVDLYDRRKGDRSIDFFDLSPSSKRRSTLSKKLQVKMNLEVQSFRKLSVNDHSIDLRSAARSQLLRDYLRVNGLLQIDKLSMSSSIEVRNPLVDFELVETILRADWNNSKTPTKALLLAADASGLSQISKTHPKRGFSPPTRLWYREIMRLFSTELKNPRCIELGLLPRNWSRYFTRPFTWHGFKSPIWFELVMLEFWIRETENRIGAKFIQK